MNNNDLSEPPNILGRQWLHATIKIKDKNVKLSLTRMNSQHPLAITESTALQPSSVFHILPPTDSFHTLHKTQPTSASHIHTEISTLTIVRAWTAPVTRSLQPQQQFPASPLSTHSPVIKSPSISCCLPINNSLRAPLSTQQGSLCHPLSIKQHCFTPSTNNSLYPPQFSHQYSAISALHSLNAAETSAFTKRSLSKIYIELWMF